MICLLVTIPSQEYEKSSSCHSSEEMSEDYVQQCCDKAMEFISKGDDEKAKKYLNKAASRDPENSRVIALLSIIAGRAAKPDARQESGKHTFCL